MTPATDPTTTDHPELVLTGITAGYFANDIVLADVSVRVAPGSRLKARIPSSAYSFDSTPAMECPAALDMA